MKALPQLHKAKQAHFFFLNLRQNVLSTRQTWRRATSMSRISPSIGITLALKLHGFYDSRGHKPSQHLVKILLVDYWRTYGCVPLWKWLLWVCSFRPACVRWRDGKRRGCLSELTETIYRTAKYQAGTACTGTEPNWVRWAGSIRSVIL